MKAKDTGRLHSVIDPPSWAMRWGIVVLAGGLLLLIGLGWLIRFADRVEVPVVVVSAQEPFRLLAPTTLRIDSLLTADGEHVAKGTPLVLVDADASLADVLDFEKFLSSLLINEQSAWKRADWEHEWQLGSLQSHFAALGKWVEEWRHLEQRGFHREQIQNLRLRLKEILLLEQNLVAQERLLLQELELARQQARRDSILLAQGSLSAAEYEMSKSLELQRRRSLEVQRERLLRNRLEAKEIEGQLLELEKAYASREGEISRQLHATASEALAAIAVWKKRHLLVAPVEGRVVLGDDRRAGQLLAAGEVILALVGSGEGVEGPIARGSMPAHAIGQVDTGAIAEVRLQAFPWEEFGSLEAVVSRIAPLPENGNYRIELRFPAGLKTKSGRQIPFREELAGVAILHIHRRSLLDRLFAKFRR